MILNFGDRMEIKPLPYLAQLAPSFGSVVADFNGDSHLDVFMLQNFFGPQVETGRMSGGLSAMLLGNGDGTFEELWPAKSGLIIPEDARSVTLCEFNDDNKPDLLVTCCDGPTRCFSNNFDDATFARIRLAGSPGNTSAIGAKISIVGSDQKSNVTMTSGSGYLAQSVADLFVAKPNDEPLNVKVEWPGGETSSTEITDYSKPIVLTPKRSKVSSRRSTDASE